MIICRLPAGRTSPSAAQSPRPAPAAAPPISGCRAATRSNSSVVNRSSVSNQLPTNRRPHTPQLAPQTVATAWCASASPRIPAPSTKASRSARQSPASSPPGSGESPPALHPAAAPTHCCVRSSPVGSTNTVCPLELDPWITPPTLRLNSFFTGITNRSPRTVISDSCVLPSSESFASALRKLVSMARCWCSIARRIRRNSGDASSLKLPSGSIFPLNDLNKSPRSRVQQWSRKLLQSPATDPSP